MGDDFAVGCRLELLSRRSQLVLESLIVLDHAIVHDGDDAVTTNVRVCVFVGRRSVGRPTSVPNSGRPAQWCCFKPIGEILNSPACFTQVDRVILEDGNASAVVAAIFKSPQAFQKKLGGITIADVPYDSTHPGPHKTLT